MERAAARTRCRRLASSTKSAKVSPAAAMARPACPLFSIDTSTPASPPATLATWLSVSDTANVDDLISSPISRCTIESCPSLARLAQKIAVNITATAAHRPNAQAQRSEEHTSELQSRREL